MVKRLHTDFGIYAVCGTGRNISMVFPVTEHIAKSARHTTFYLACGGAHRPVVIFVHGWLELFISWRHQLPCFASHCAGALPVGSRYQWQGCRRDRVGGHTQSRFGVAARPLLELALV